MSTGEYRHPKHDLAAELLRQGVTVQDTAARVGMARSAVRRVRALENIPPSPRTVPIGDKLAASTVWLDETDHAVWSGKRNHGTPVIRHRGGERSAAGVAYETARGRAPYGIAKSECHLDGGPEHCMNPAHILDERDRQTERRQLRMLYGYGPTADFCEAGHDQDEHGKLEPDLTPYCGLCNTLRRNRNR